MPELPEYPELREVIAQFVEATPENFRMAAQIYADQLSLLRRTFNAVTAAVTAAASNGPSVLFDFSNDPLKALALDDRIIEYHTRVVDLLVMSAVGQVIEISEYQDYAKSLVGLYGGFDFLARLKDSALKNQDLQALEQEWLKETDFGRVQSFFRTASLGVKLAAQYSNISINPLPEF